MGPGRLSRREDGSWVLDYRDAEGRRRRRVLGRDKRVAERRRMELIRRRDMQVDGLGAAEGQDLRLDEIVPDYLEDLGARVTPHHLKNVRGKLDRALAEWGQKRVRDLRQTDAVRYRNALSGSGLSNRTVNLHVDVVRAMLRWAVSAGVIAENPLERLRSLPYGRDQWVYRRRALSDEEIGVLLAASHKDDDENYALASLSEVHRVPQTPMWRLFLETGARWNELRQLTWGDIDLGRALIALRAETTKSRRQRAVPLRPEVVDELVRLRARHESVVGRLPNREDRVLLSPEGRPWGRPTTNPMRILDRVLVRAGIPKVDRDGRKLDIHALRHTFASRLARGGVGLVHAQRLLGHSDPKLTAQVYTHLDVEDLRDAVGGLPSLGDGAAKAKEAR